MIGKDEYRVLNELRERSDGQDPQGREHVDTADFDPKLLRSMAEEGLVRLSGTLGNPRAWLVEAGVKALLTYETETR